MEEVEPEGRPVEKWTTIKISKQTRARLEKFGRFGDSLDDLVKRLCDIAER